jgi:hypothetical protein
MTTLKGYFSNPKTLSGIVDVVADTARVGGVVIDNDNIGGISNFTATDITCTNLVATTITGGTITYSTATINDLIVNDTTLIDCDMNLTSSNSYNINNVDVLNATTLGSSVVNSSLTSVGTLTGLTVSGNISCSGNVSGTLTTSSQPNITLIGNLTSLTVLGNISGTLTTASQPNITSIGSLTLLTVSGTATLNELQVTGDTLLANTGIVGYLRLIDDTYTTEINIIPAYKNTTQDGNYVTYKIDNGTVSKSHYFVGLVEMLNTLKLNSNITQIGGTASLQALTVPSISCSGNISGTLTTSSQPNVTSIGNLTSLTVSGNISCSGNLSGTLTTASQPNITSIGTLASLNVSGNISCSGNLSGTLTTASQPNITSIGTLASLNVSGNITNGSLILKPNTKGNTALSGVETIGNEQTTSSFANLTFTSDSQFGYVMSATSNSVSPVSFAYMGFGSSVGQWGSLTNYNNLGVYTGSSSVVSSGTTYTGERLQIQFPSLTVLKSWTFGSPTNANGSYTKDYALIASKNGSTWNTLATGTSLSGTQIVDFTENFSIGYTYFAIVIRSLTVATSGSVARATANNISFTGWTFPSITQSIYIPQSLEVGRTSLPNSLPNQALVVNGDGALGGRLIVGSLSPNATASANLVIQRNGTTAELFVGGNGGDNNTGIIKYVYDSSGSWFQVGHWGDNLDTTGTTFKKGGQVGVGYLNPISGFRMDINGFSRFRIPCFWVYRTGSWTASANSSIVSSSGTVGFDYNPAFPATGTGWNTSIGMYGVGASTTGMPGVYHFDVYLRASDGTGFMAFNPQVYNSLTTTRSNIIKNADGMLWIPQDPNNRRSGMFSCNVILNPNENFLPCPRDNTITWNEIQVSGHFVSHLG